ncbi:MAG: hypothetical protein K6E18_03600 [Lachnospiraceae bacterium]|nr:hypothetical protein [Lachnospiraceae bacterium]
MKPKTRDNRALKRRPVQILIGVILLMGLMGCGKQKYKVVFDGYGFTSDKKAYAPGDPVTVYYDMVATDTDYQFSCDEDVDLKQTFDNAHGYVFTFTMPEHDVTFQVSSRNTMEYDPDAHLPETPKDLQDEIDPDNMAFDFYEKTMATDGGDGHEEYVLYERNEGEGMILAKYTQEGDEAESVSCCLVPTQIWDSCMHIVRSRGCADWNENKGVEGTYYVLKFPDGKGNMVRVTSDEMPGDGMETISLLKGVLSEAFGKYHKEEAVTNENQFTGFGMEGIK